jgi:hypothetical protein
MERILTNESQRDGWMDGDEMKFPKALWKVGME